MSEEATGSSAENERTDSATLSQIFDNAFELFNAINKADEPTNSSKIQSYVKRAMTMLEDATRLVSVVDMFSENENFDEVATENIKYFLLPALLGTLATKICDSQDRMHIVNVAEIYFLDFLKRVKVYGLTDIEIPQAKTEDNKEDTEVRKRSEAELITEMVTKRNTKLQRYKEKKDLESRLDTLQKNMDNPNIDDEVKRDYFVTLVKLYINTAIDELASIASEKPILEHMKIMGKSETLVSKDHRPHKTEPPKLQPIIITRDQMQKMVYGTGYPSLPVMTVEEFYDQKVKDGEWPEPGQRNKINSKSLQDMANTNNAGESQDEIDAIEKEKQIDADDPELLERMRTMDEYKDTHRRGWGNRANRS